LGDPVLLLLDEPTRSLDHEAVDRMWKALDARRSTAVLIATHRDEDVEHCSRVLHVGS
jgi:ABC-type multidrug transport system ATPase subunit